MQDPIETLRELKAAYEIEGTQFGAAMARWCQEELEWRQAQRRRRKKFVA